MNTPLTNFYKAYAEEQAALGQHLSAQTELERKKRELYISLAKYYDQEQMPDKLIVESPFGSLLQETDGSLKAPKQLVRSTVLRASDGG